MANREQRIINIEDTIRCNIYLIGILEEEMREHEVNAIFEDTMAETTSQLRKGITPYIQEPQ